jgi:hypothetical protein
VPNTRPVFRGTAETTHRSRGSTGPQQLTRAPITLPPVADAFIRKQKIRPGKTERLREWIAEMHDAADAGAAREIWSAESLHTISLFVEHAADGDYLVWFPEADSMEQLVEARRASTHPLHDLEDEMMAEVLEDPDEAGEFGPLLHGVSPGRPNDYSVERYPDGS